MNANDRRRRLLDRLVTIGWISGAVAIVLVALYVVLAGQLLSLLEKQRADVAAWTGQQLDLRVEIDAIEGNMRLLTPVVRLRGVRLFVKDTPEAPALAAPAIDLEVAPFRSLLARRPVLDLLRIEGIDLTLVQDEDGRFRVKGMPFKVNDPLAAERLRQALAVVYRQRDIVVERARVVVESERLPVTAIEDIRLHMHNEGDRHAIGGRATLLGPSRVPASFVLQFDGSPVLPAELVAALYLRVSPSSLEGWLPRRDAGELWIDALSGGGEAWLQLRDARVMALTSRVQIDSLAVSLADGRKVEGLLGASARVRWQPLADGWQLALDGLGFRRQGQAWPESSGALEWRRDAEGRRRVRVALSAGSLPMLAGFADLLPPDRVDLGRLARIAPQGQLRDLRFAWDEPAEPAARWRLAAGFTQLAVQADGALPGLSGVGGRIELQPDAGMASVAVSDGQLVLPQVFTSPLPLAEGALRIVWRRQPDGGWQLASNRFTLRNADARASGLLTLQLPPGDASPRLQLLGLIEDGNPAATPRYLPLAVSDGLREWLTSALGAGRLTRGSFLFDGPVRREASTQSGRTFQMRYEGSGLSLAFLPEWPRLESADADVLIDGGHVVARARQARLLDSQLGDITVAVTPRDRAPSQLDVQAQVNGDLADMFRLFRDTPLRSAVPAELLRWDGNGRLDAQVRVVTALGGSAAPHVTASGNVAGATLTSTAHALEISDVSGALRFDSKDGFSGQDMRGTALGSALAGTARTSVIDGRQQTVVDLRGRLRMQPVNAWLKLPALDVLRGEAESALTLRFDTARGGDSRLELRSDLRGISSTAPAPLAKPADAAVDTRFSYTLGTDKPRLTLNYGRALAADLVLSDGAPVSGAVALGNARLAPNAGAGIVIEGSAPSLVIGDWLAFVGRLAGGAAAPAGDFSLSRAVAGMTSMGERLQRINVSATRMDVGGGLLLDDATLGFAREPAGWLLRVDSDQLRGQALLPDGYQERGDKPLVLQLDAINLPATTAARLGVGPALSPASLPRMAVAINAVRVGAEDYGSWSFEVVPDGQQALLRDVHGAWRALDIQGEGAWFPVAGGSRTRFAGAATADDLARVSEAFGFAPNLSSEQARADFDLSWSGRPTDFDPLRAAGTVALDFRAGRFVTGSARSQALRALGVFNVNTWQRRMKFDFTDLYRKGVAFDTLTGKLALEGGRVSTQDLVVKGPSAMFELSGTADLASDTLDTRLRVTLPLNSNLYVGCLAGLAACAGIVAFEQLWGDRLEKMTTLAYDVSGNWNDPQVRQVEGAPAPARKD